jgi:post-segregation antitoxin (ccd killing protein)
MQGKPGDKPPPAQPPAPQAVRALGSAEVKVAVDPELLRKARVRAFELGTTVEKLLARLVGHLAKEQDQVTILQQQRAPEPKARLSPVGETGGRVELRRPVLPPLRGRTGKTG